MTRSSLCNFSAAYILAKGIITVPNTGTVAAPNHAKDIDVVVTINNLIEYSENYLKTSGSLWQY